MVSLQEEESKKLKTEIIDEEKEKEDEEAKKEDDRMSYVTCLSCRKCSQPIKNSEKERYVLALSWLQSIQYLKYFCLLLTNRRVIYTNFKIGCLEPDI